MARDRYSKPSKSKGGIGLKTTLAEEELGKGKVSVSAGLSIDVLPVDVAISLDDGNLGVKGEIGLPGDVVAVGGGVVIDLDTGQVVGGSASVSAAGATVEISQVECEKSISISYFGVSAAYSENICKDDDDDDDDQNNEGDEDDHKPPPIPSPNPPPDPNDIPSVSGFIVCETGIPVYHWLLYLDNIVEWRGSQSMFSSTKRSCSLPSEFSLEMEKIHWASSFKRTLRGSGLCIDMQLGQPNSGGDSATYSFNDLLPKYFSEAGDRTFLSWGFHTKISNESGLKIIYTSNLKLCIQALNSINYLSKQTIINSYENKTYSQSTCSPGTTGIVVYSNIFYGWFPTIRLSENNKTRRPIPPEKNMNECCDASISLLRKISQVLAVDTILAENGTKISTDTVENFKQQYDQLAQSLPEGQKPKVEFDNYLEFKIYQLAIGDNAMIEDIATVLNCKEMLRGTQPKSSKQDIEEGGIVAPNSLIMCQGEGTTQMRDYLALSEFLIRMIDHLGLHPSEIKITDVNKGKEGDQPISFEFYSGSAMINRILELAFENKGDAATRLQIQVRTVWLLHQIFSMLTKVHENSKNIVNFLEIPMKEVTTVLKTPFDILLGKRENFKKAKSKPSEEDMLKILEEDTEESVEGILDKFLNVSDHVVTVTRHVSGMGLGFWYSIRNLRK